MRVILLLLILIAPVAAQRGDAVLIDQFASAQCEDFRGRLDLFLAELSNSPASRGVVIGYEGKYTDYRPSVPKLVLPVFGEVNTRMRILREHFDFRGFDPSRVTYISGGYRDNHEFELFKVPPGGKFPVAKPAIDSMTYRRGKPTPLTGC